MPARRAPGFALQCKIRFAVDGQKIWRTTDAGLGKLWRRKGGELMAGTPATAFLNESCVHLFGRRECTFVVDSRWRRIHVS